MIPTIAPASMAQTSQRTKPPGGELGIGNTHDVLTSVIKVQRKRGLEYTSKSVGVSAGMLRLISANDHAAHTAYNAHSPMRKLNSANERGLRHFARRATFPIIQAIR